MTDNSRSRAWLCLAVIYFSIGVVLGVMMGASGDHSFFPLHAHINLLGWVSMSLFGIIAAVYPATSQGTVATLQFWIHNLGLPVLLVSLAAKLKGYDAVEPVLGLASITVGLGVLLFAYQVITTLRTRPATATAATSSTA
jgi:hypothetical protein